MPSHGIRVPALRSASVQAAQDAIAGLLARPDAIVARGAQVANGAVWKTDQSVGSQSYSVLFLASVDVQQN